MLYLIKVNIILALLCLLFQVVMHRDTFFGVRRAMLWGVYLTAFLLPLCDVHAWMQGESAAMYLASDYATYVLPTFEVTASRVAAMGMEQTEPGCGMWFVGVMMLWGLIYLVPVVWMTLKLIWQLIYIIYLRCTCRREGTFFRYPRPCSPFSFGPWIFLHPDDMDEQTLHQVLIHEQAHVNGWHTVDILFTQLVCILFWWNPAVWVLRREVRLNLEFIADAAVIGTQADKREYQYRLLGFSTQMNVATISNNFNVLPLKRRIIMMNSRRTRRTGMLKYILFVPVAAALLFAFNIDSLARTLENQVKKTSLFENRTYKLDLTKPITPIRTFEGLSSTPLRIDGQPVKSLTGNWLDGIDLANVVITEDDEGNIVQIDLHSKIVSVEGQPQDQVYDVVEVLPKYQGGEAALYEFLMRNVKYPAAAIDYGVQGRVIVSFIVEKDGTLSNINTAKVYDPKSGQELSEVTVVAHSNLQTPEQAEAAKHQAEGIKALKAEAERVVKALPHRWEPGKKDGKPARTRFNLPVLFRLQ